MAQAFGTAQIFVNGATQASLPGSSIDIGGNQNTPVVDDNGNVNYVVKRVPSEINAEIVMDGTTSLATIASWTDVTVQFSCDTGQNYVVNHAFIVDPPKATSGQGGKIPLKFNGPAAQEA